MYADSRTPLLTSTAVSIAAITSRGRWGDIDGCRAD